MKRLIFLVFATLFCSTTIWAEDIKFTVSAPKVVEVGEQFHLSFSVNKRGSGLTLPKLDNFDILMGPSTSSSSSTQIINGKVSRTSSYTYTYVLVAKKEGKFTIQPTEITVKGEKYKSNKLTIEVLKGSTKPQKTKKQPSATTSNQRITNKNIFVAVEVSNKSVYMGEDVLATIKLYTKLSVSGFGDTRYPSFNGFLTQDIPISSQINMQRENINGEIYNVGVIRRILLFPQHTGEITIEPFELECFVRQRRSSRSRSFFDDFFDNYQDVSVRRKSKSIKIRVKNLPPAPADFNGAVGQFNLSASIDKDSVKANDAITLKVKISGNGNLKLINPLKFNMPADFEVYDPKTIQNISSSLRGMTGTTTFEYLVIPRYAGKFTIPKSNFVYFDLKTRRYVSKQTPKFEINVTKDKDAEVSGIISTIAKEDVKFIGRDIRYIKTNEIKTRLKGGVLFGTFNFYLGYSIPLALFLLAFLLNRKRIKENADIARVKNKRANREAKKRLKTAAQSLKDNNTELFYDDILKALWGYTSDKLNLPLSNLNKENIAEILQGKNVEQEITDKFLNMLNTCEFARYAPAAGSSQMDDVYIQTVEIITTLEKNIK